MAQRWELGVGAGAGIFPSQTVTRGSQPATTGFANGVAATAYVGQNMHRRIGGEIRYTFSKNNLKLQSGSTKVGFGAQSQAVEYDLLFHLNDEARTIRPYAVLGGGMKYYQGTGTETVVQPLSQFAYLTRTGQWKPMFTFGGGVKWRIGKSAMFRVEGRDSLTPFPNQVIAPAPGATVGGWVNQILIFASLAILF